MGNFFTLTQNLQLHRFLLKWMKFAHKTLQSNGKRACSLKIHLLQTTWPNQTTSLLGLWMVAIRVGYRSKISIPIPWVRYRFLNDTFFNTNFMKSVLTRYTLSQKIFYFFSACWHLYRLKASSPELLHKGTKYIQHNKSVQIILIKLK